MKGTRQTIRLKSDAPYIEILFMLTYNARLFTEPTIGHGAVKRNELKRTAPPQLARSGQQTTAPLRFRVICRPRASFVTLASSVIGRHPSPGGGGGGTICGLLRGAALRRSEASALHISGCGEAWVGERSAAVAVRCQVIDGCGQL